MRNFLNLQILITISLPFMLLGLFQNCGGITRSSSSGTTLSSETSAEPVQTNITPPAPTLAVTPPPAPPTPIQGLAGKLYYLTMANNGADLGGDLSNARFNDYFNAGIAGGDVELNDISIGERDYLDGFPDANGNLLTDLNNNLLVEHYGVRMDGFLRLPNGFYDFAILSDDGMAISLDGQTVVTDSEPHRVRLACSDPGTPVGFNSAISPSKTLLLEYYQAEQVLLAMTLYYRPADPNGGCDTESIANDGWSIVPASAYIEF